ncbi:carbohydrate kinase [Paraflavisolibacter sp. H34]|uniref:carbohydrate kinase family protein n=1 Tax=Huijunlia imazamoxiresistens TaxID=3127457 RepID=UPI00301B02FA
MKHDVVCYGEILWDVLPGKTLPGGAPMNVAYHLKKLGAHPALISRVGNDAWGEKLMKVLSDSGLRTGYVQADAHYPTGLVTATPGAENEMAYDIVQPVAWDFIGWQDLYASLVQQAPCFVFGSLAARSEVSRRTLHQLLEVAKTKVLDINLRPPHFHRGGLEELLHKADVLKMNENELHLLAGWYGSDLSPEGSIRLLQDHFHIGTIIVTMGGEGAMVLDKGTFYCHPGYRVSVSDTIGSGDAFLAGFLYNCLGGASVEQSLAYACALGALIATYPGACPDYETSRVDQLMRSRSPQPLII